MSPPPPQCANEASHFSPEVPQPWRCGDDFQYRLPEPEGDPWSLLLKPLLEKDTAQCNAWVDEVQNLLIFAGLFSAVVTAFAVETYQNLQQDPMLVLLTQIAAQSTNNASAGVQPPFAPSASIIRVNIFLFLSLILSLSSVLVGIIALQWIREHRQYSNTLAPQNMFATLHMRMEALNKWHVPQIFALLPLILQCALVLFFAGIVQLLIDTCTMVLIPVACIIGVTIIFLLVTTILPTAQAATLAQFRNNVPTPCPFKSPQANAFRRLTTSSETLFKLTSFSFSTAYWTVHHILLLPRKIFILANHSKAISVLLDSIRRISGFVTGLFRVLLCQVLPLVRLLRNSKREQWHGFDYMDVQITKYWTLYSWFEFDLGWMSIRDNYFKSICPPDTWLFKVRENGRDYAALYDAAQGLCEELTRGNFNVHVEAEPAIIRAYHCALTLCAPLITHIAQADDVVESHLERNMCLATLLGLGETTPLRPFSNNLKPPDLPMFREEASFIFLSFIQEYLNSINERSPLLTNHYAEVYFRLLGELYSKPYEMNEDVLDTRSNDVIFDGEELYAMKIYDAPNQPFTHQWALSITTFFSVLGDRSIPQSIIATSFHAHPFFHGYSANFWREVMYEIHTETIQDTTINEIINTFSVIRDILDECFTGIHTAEADHARNKLIFQSIAVHLWNYTTRDIISQTVSESASITIESLRAAQKRFLSTIYTRLPDEQNSNLSLYRAWLAESWWAKLFPDATDEHPIHPIAPPTQPYGDLTIDFHAESDG